MQMGDIDLAKECASELTKGHDNMDSDLFFDDDWENTTSDETKRRIWLLIGNYVFGLEIISSPLHDR